MSGSGDLGELYLQQNPNMYQADPVVQPTTRYGAKKHKVELKANDLAIHGQTVLDEITFSYNYVNVTLITSDRNWFNTHKMLLGSASCYLNSLLQDVSDEENALIILPDFTLDSLKYLNEFLHRGAVQCQSGTDFSQFKELTSLLQLDPQFRLKKETRYKSKGISVKLEVADTSDIDDNDSSENCFPDEFLSETEENVNSQDEENYYIDNLLASDISKAKRKFSKRKQKPRKNKENQEMANFKCEHCGKEYSHQTILDAHLLEHTCDICGKTYDLKSSLKDHKKTHLDPNAKSVCDICGGNYKDANTLKVHIQTQHEMTDRPFSCELCGDKFKTKGSLTIHSSKHMTDRSFVCDECGFQTKNKYLLKAHLNTHKDVKQFQCTQCPKSFNHQFILDKHVRIHTGERPFACEECGTDFTSGIHLRRHTKTVHKLARDFMCTICSAPFKRLGELKRHIILHSGEKPFECRTCGESFRHREAGRRHIKAAHPGVEASITFKPSDTIGELSKTAVKKLTPSEIANGCFSLQQPSQRNTQVAHQLPIRLVRNVPNTAEVPMPLVPNTAEVPMVGVEPNQHEHASLPVHLDLRTTNNV